MKTQNEQLKSRTLRSIITGVLILNFLNSSAQEIQHSLSKSNDHLFPAKGKSMINIATGFPWVGLGEYAIGISDRFSIGILGGTTHELPGYGIRIRLILIQKNENFRVYARLPILYYPTTEKLSKPWIASLPAINAEWKTSSGTRLSLGAGIVEANCVAFMLGQHKAGEPKPGCPNFMIAAFNTFQAGIAVPMTPKIMFHSEVATINTGLKLADIDRNAIGKTEKGNFRKGIPAIISIGLAYSL